jgi:ribonuclease VapC
MFVDACAIVSLMTGEATAPAYEASLAQTAMASTSAMAAWEAIIVLSQPGKLDLPYSRTETIVCQWLEARRIELREPTSPRTVLSHAVAVAEHYGLGKRGLSNLDCFHYAYAKTLRLPLLTLDAELRRTDIQTAP